MKSRLLKILTFAICIIAVMPFLAGCVKGCTTKKYEEREVGDFVVRFFEDYCEIKGTTEQINDKKSQIIY